ncbi:hypothetical protein CEE37_03700 [candidate division LCP-89 bacterium B3_LCP]|uniref:non-specific serine/threonine protein kinase n=1 Tax=candidate division LCP-89 bacterium B3_LCP TaxID=2012998 RepID=A0A532V3H6_UNCL8|nr:MAG: hypothetical protein CEE37_03700 [candidate division LCP-89 bacterium B3_LCP]
MFGNTCAFGDIRSVQGHCSTSDMNNTEEKNMTDLDTIKQIEKILKLKLEELDEVDWYTRGYTINFKGEVTGLSLYDCKISNLSLIISPLEGLTSLTALYLAQNLLNDISPLEGLVNLTELNLGINHLSDISPLKGLTNLTRLDLSNSRLSDISPLKGLTNLTKLEINSNHLSDISPLKDLSNLTTLYLQENHLSDISPLKGLTNLTTVHLGSNQLSDISPLKSLTNLTELDLGGNKLSDISPLNGLTNLTELDLGGNKLSDISPLNGLTNLTKLHLPNNQLSDISPLEGLTKLKDLVLLSNQLSDISPLEGLTNLTELLLYDNKLSDITPLKDLTKLNLIDFDGNPLKILPPWITDFNMDIKWTKQITEGCITFYGNPLQTPPVEIVKQGKEAVRSYFASLKDKKKVVKLNEVRILLVGDGMAGKTSLLKQIQGLEFNENESQTHGINVLTLPANDIRGLGNLSKIKDCQLHFWDFGGQEIMHASHQFFLSKRSLYILVLDSRTDSKKYYWLKHIEKYGGDSPLIVVMNKMDENPNYNIEQKKINDGFSNIGNRFFRLSCKDKEGLPEYLTCLGKTIPETSLYGTDINIDWINIRDKLIEATQASNYISRKEFIKICTENNVKDESSQLTLLKFLHDLGVVLFFEKLQLASIYVLDPHWVTIGVYKIINSAKIKEGILRERDLDYILNKEVIKKEEYDPAREKKITYSLDEQRYIIDIMMQFDLCYEYDQDNNHYIIPDLLPKELKNEPELDEGTPLRFVMKYDYLPTPVISRLMIRLKNDIVKGQQWKYGMILENEEFNCKAKVRSDEENKTIEITVQGEMRCKQKYFSAILYQLNDINRSFENLNIEEFIPLPGHQDILVDYKELLGFERASRDEYFVGKLGEEFSVSEMLDSVISKDDRIKHHSRGGEDTLRERFDRLDEKLDAMSEENKSALKTILSRLDESEKTIVNLIYQKIDDKEITQMETFQVLADVAQGIEQLEEKMIKGEDIDRIKQIYDAVNKTDDVTSKFKLTIPIIPLLLSFEQELDISSSLNKFWKKMQNCLF